MLLYNITLQLQLAIYVFCVSGSCIPHICTCFFCTKRAWLHPHYWVLTGKACFLWLNMETAARIFAIRLQWEVVKLVSIGLPSPASPRGMHVVSLADLGRWCTLRKKRAPYFIWKRCELIDVVSVDRFKGRRESTDVPPCAVDRIMNKDARSRADRFKILEIPLTLWTLPQRSFHFATLSIGSESCDEDLST